MIYETEITWDDAEGISHTERYMFRTVDDANAKAISSCIVNIALRVSTFIIHEKLYTIDAGYVRGKIIK